MVEVRTVIPNEFAVIGQPNPEDLDQLAQEGYKTLISNRPDSEKQDQPSAQEIRAAAEELGLKYIHIPVKPGSISRRDIELFDEALKEAPAPVVAHCGSGQRAYLLWAASEALYRGRSVDELIERGTGLGLDVKELGQIVQQTAM